MSTSIRELHAELLRRINISHTNYHHSLMSLSKQELIGMAGKIVAWSDAYEYMAFYHGFKEDELRFYLQFQNPLMIVADKWYEHRNDFSDMSNVVDSLLEYKAILSKEYPLENEINQKTDERLYRFMNVDLADFLSKIAEKVIISYPDDVKYDIDELRKYATNENFKKAWLVWNVCSVGTQLKPESSVFIKDSGAYEYITDYHQNDADMFGYVIEVTGMDGNTIKGNVFEVGNYADYAKHIRDTALPLSLFTLTYLDRWGINDGKSISVSRKEFEKDRHRLMCESGDAADVLPHPKNEQELSKILQQEHSRLMVYPISSQQAHMDKLSEKLAVIRKPPDQTLKPPGKAQKTSLTEQLKDAGVEARENNSQRTKSPANKLKKHNKEID